MTGEVIKSFLVGLGFEVDDASLGKFNQAIKVATARVAALYGSIKLLSSAIVYNIAQISAGFEQMGYEYHIIAPAINKALVLRRELLKAYSAAGINITKVIQQSVRLNMSLAKTKFAFEAIYKSVASRFFGLLIQQSENLRKTVYANMPKILHALETFVKFVFKAADAANQLGGRLWSILTRVYDFFVELNEKTHGFSNIILGIIAAWEILNLEFLATPLGMLIAGLTTIIALFDDFKTFQEGGESLFNWSSFIPVIDAVAGALQYVWKALNGIAEVIADVIYGFYQLFHGDKDGAFDTMIAGVQALLGVFQTLWEVIKGVGSSIYELGIWGARLLGLAGGAAPGQPGASLTPSSSTFIPTLTHPIGASPQGPSQTNQNLQQQTNINVIGASDANAVGKAVAGEQTRVNFDMTRNMRGATR